MLKLTVRRQPLSEHSYFAEKTFEATLRVEHVNDHRWIDLSFATNTDGQKISLFDLAISPKHFADVARMMAEAEPAAAIQAFGAAMQSADVERRLPTKDVQAA
jgi:hypothetical protein